MHGNKIDLSIVIPVYNLDSIISQSLKNVEIIIVNDGSTDNSLEIINLYKERDCRIKVINKENGD